MKFAVSSASFAAAFALFATKHSNAAMASAVNASYESKAEQFANKHSNSLAEKKVKQVANMHSKFRSHGKECSYVSSGLRGNEADTGVLGCADSFICVEDSHSSLGGRCVVESRDLSVNRLHRDLQTCTTKCEGFMACYFLSDAEKALIADGSCCGDFACFNFNGSEFIFALNLFVPFIFIYQAFHYLLQLLLNRGGSSDHCPRKLHWGYGL